MMYLLAGFEICSAAPTRKPLSALPHFHNSKIMLLFIYKDLIKQPIKISSLTVTMESYLCQQSFFYQAIPEVVPNRDENQCTPRAIKF